MNTKQVISALKQIETALMSRRYDDAIRLVDELTAQLRRADKVMVEMNTLAEKARGIVDFG